MAEIGAKKDHLFIHAATWNLGNTVPPTASFDGSEHHWRDFVQLRPSSSAETVGAEAPTPASENRDKDLAIFSFQEIDQHSELFEGEEPWTQSLTEELTSDSGFVRLAAVRMDKILLLVFVRRPLLPRVRNLRTTYTKTGLGGLRGNKGGVTVRLTLMEREICIVGCHLAAHLSEQAERIVDFTSILDEQRFQFPDVSAEGFRILDHDYVIVAGDLNFRLDDIPRQEVIDQLALVPDDDKRNDDVEAANHRRAVFDGLLAHDQLLKAFNEEECFAGFAESRIDFKPTYKFDYGEWMRWDSSHKQRKPAWTDRVIWRLHPQKKAKTRLRVESGDYSSDHAFVNSDHKPVVSQLHLRVEPFADGDVNRVKTVAHDEYDSDCDSDDDKSDSDHAQYAIDTIALEAVGGEWRQSADGVCRLSFPRGFRIGSRDWVGIFAADKLPHLRAYVTWYWVSSALDVEEEGRSESVKEITFESKYLKALTEDLSASDRAAEGPHQLIYISGDYDNVFGVSAVFDVRP